jgi:hypothetical protein
MKFVLSMLVLATILISQSNSITQLTEDDKAVQKVLIDLFQAIANCNGKEIRKNCTADITLYESGAIWNLDSLIFKVELNKSPDFDRINQIDFIETKIANDVAWLTYYNFAEISKKGNKYSKKWLETVILVKENNLWKVKLLHSTTLKVSQ